MIDYLIKSAEVVWIAQVGGPYQIVFSVSIRKLYEINQFLEKLTLTLGPVLNHTDLIVQLQFNAFGRKYLDSSQKTAPILSFGHNPQDTHVIDQIDQTIIEALYKGDVSSERSIAVKLRIPLTTLRRRIQNLENKKVLIGYIYRFNLNTIGLSRFCLLVSVKGLSTIISKKMYEFCANHQRIVNLSECLGSWQFEITVEIESPVDTVSIIRDIGEVFGSEVSQIITVPVFKSFKYSSYPPQQVSVSS